ncbi:unnamed protein product [Effrenium voratum]|nr:unnamed protein product [Effrenium voratum]
MRMVSSPSGKLALEQALIIHSVQIKRDGHWLGFLDLLLYASHCSVALKVVLNDGELTLMPMKQLLESMACLPGPEIERLLGKADEQQAEWHVCLSRADFQASRIDEMNHWLPARPLKDKGSNVWPKAVEDLDATTCWYLAEDGVHQYSDSVDAAGSSDEERAILSSLVEQRRHLLQFQAFSWALRQEHNLLAVDVRGDGNCGCYALTQLTSGFSSNPDSFDSSDVREESQADTESPDYHAIFSGSSRTSASTSSVAGSADERAHKRPRLSGSSSGPEQTAMSETKFGKATLGHFGITYSQWMSRHYTMFGRKAGVTKPSCDSGGWVSLQISVSRKQRPSCQACQAMLDESSLAFTSSTPGPLCLEMMPREAPAESAESLAAIADHQQPLQSWEPALETLGGDADDDDGVQDVREHIATHMKDVFSVLPAFSHGKTYPVMCHICVSKRQGNKKVIFSLVDIRRKKYLRQHIMSKRQKAPCVDAGRCEGLSLAAVPESKLGSIMSQDVVIWSSGCTKSTATVVLGRSTCEACCAMGSNRWVLRNVGRLHLKLQMAKYLSAKLFMTDQEAEETLEETRQLPCLAQHREKVAEMAAMTLDELQEDVRRKFVCVPLQKESGPMRAFRSHVVQPSMDVVVSECNGDRKAASLRLCAAISSGSLGSIPEDEIQFVKSLVSGSIQNDPMLHGLMIAVAQRATKLAKGCTTMRHLEVSDDAREKMAEAGMALAMAGANQSLLKNLGLAHTFRKLDFSSLESAGMPDPVPSCVDLNRVLKSNLLLIEQARSKAYNKYNDKAQAVQKQAVEMPLLCLGFDGTYLSADMSPMKTRFGPSMLGGCFSLPVFGKDECNIALNAGEEVDLSNVKRAKEVMQCLIWDPALEHCPCISLTSIPMHPAVSVPRSVEWLRKNQFGLFETLITVGEILDATCHKVGFVFFDNASKHQWCKSLLLGKPVPIDDPDLQSLKFWPRIQYIPLPRHEVPGLDYKAAFVGGHFVIPFAGVAHAQKNAAGQMRSALRTIYVGRYWVDTSACLQFGCPPAAWTGEDLQSDAQAACLMSPVFMVEDMDQPVPHWATMGALAFSTALAMPFAAILHTGLTVAERAELAACGHVFIDLMMMVARQLESERGVRKGSLSISNITARNLKDLAAAVLLMTSQVDELWCDPRYLSEIRIEMFFGRCRTSFTNSAFTYRQYLQSSMRERLQADLMAWVDRQGLQDFHGPVGDEDEDEEEEDSDMAADDESQEGLLGVIEKLRRDEAFATEEAVEELDDDEALRKHRRKTSAAAEELLKQLKELAQVAGCPEPDGTLADVLRMPGNKRAGTLEQIEPRLHSLCMFLRHGDMRSLGCDSGYVQNLGSIRKRRKGLNWHNLLEQQFKQLRSNQAETQKRQSRMSAWIQLTKQVRESLEIEAWPPCALLIGFPLDLPQSRVAQEGEEQEKEKMGTGDVVLFSTPSNFSATLRVGVVLTVWRLGAPSGTFMARAACTPWVVPITALACKLGAEEFSFHGNGMRIVLDASSERALQHQDALPRWPLDLLKMQARDAREEDSGKQKKPPMSKTAKDAKDAKASKTNAGAGGKCAKPKPLRFRESKFDLEALPDNFRRNDPGRKLMKQQAQRLMEVYEQNWPEKPLRDSSGKMLCLSPKHQGLTWPNLVSRCCAKSPLQLWEASPKTQIPDAA